MKTLLLISAFLFQANSMFACDCDIQDIRKEYITSDIVLSAHVEGIIPIDTFGYRIIVTISELFKGDSIKDIMVYSGHENSIIQTSCDFDVRTG